MISLPNFMVKVEGLPWPEEIGDFRLMGPINSLGAWRWYKRVPALKRLGLVRVKVNSQLEAIQWVFNHED
jgi:hypothetical protein